jgi:ADP-heptose:LPS heptosyltransferase
MALATLKSFGDFVIAHSTLRRIEASARSRIRLIAGDHVAGLHALLPADVPVTLVDSGPERRVPALFDLRRRGLPAAIRSAFSLRRELARLGRRAGETLAFDQLGVRERFIAGRWPLTGPLEKADNIYETYRRFLSGQRIEIASAPAPVRAAVPRSVGVFPEAGRIAKRLTAGALTVIRERTGRAGLETRVFILEGDPSPSGGQCDVVTIPRNFESLMAALLSVGCVVSADSLPAHLAEYFARPVFVASPVPNEYWLPEVCFAKRYWGTFEPEVELAASLDRFLAEIGWG